MVSIKKKEISICDVKSYVASNFRVFLERDAVERFEVRQALGVGCDHDLLGCRQLP